MPDYGEPVYPVKPTTAQPTPVTPIKDKTQAELDKMDAVYRDKLNQLMGDIQKNKLDQTVGNVWEQAQQKAQKKYGGPKMFQK